LKPPPDKAAESFIRLLREEEAAAPEVIKELEELLESLRHLRDAIHDANLEENDKLAKPRLERRDDKAA
jgi:hypothetical protein